MWDFCGFSLKHGEKKQVVLRIGTGGQVHRGKVAVVPPGTEYAGPEDGYEMPVTLICGAKPGKTVLITAAIHSGEYIGISAAVRAAKALDPAEMAGNVAVFHCVNISGFWQDTLTVLPEDGFNLNRSYPGRADGTPGERIADWFCREVFPKVDFIFDLHGGGVNEEMDPLIFFPHAEKVREESFAAARALGFCNLVESWADRGEYSYAANYFGVPGLLAERGSGFFSFPDQEKDDERDIRLLLDHLGVTSFGEKKPEIRRIHCAETIYMEAEEQGIWRPAVSLREHFTKGQLLGTTEDFFGNVIREYRAEDDGVVFYLTRGLPVHEGSALVAYGLSRGIRELE